MSRICILIVLLLAASAFAGCAVSSTASSEETAAAMKFEVPEGRGVVYLYRTGRFIGSANSIEVKVNGQTAGGTSPGTFFRWELKPGTHTFHSQAPESSATVQVNVQAGSLYFIEQNARIGLDSGRVSMSQVSEANGKKRVQGMKLIVSAYVPE